MGNGRNVINVLSSDVVIACAGGAGTISEVALALKSSKPVILLNFNLTGILPDGEDIHRAENPEEAVKIVKDILGAV